MLNSELQLPNSSLCPDDPEQSGACKIVSAIVVIGKLMGIKVISELIHAIANLSEHFIMVYVTATRQQSLKQITVLFLGDRCPSETGENLRLQKKMIEDV